MTKPKDVVIAVIRLELDETGHVPNCDCPKDGKKASSGVTSDAYRKGWDAIFGKVPVGQA